MMSATKNPIKINLIINLVTFQIIHKKNSTIANAPKSAKSMSILLRINKNALFNKIRLPES